MGMTDKPDPRIEAAARALCVLGGGHTTDGTYPSCDHVAQHEDGARVALAAADAVDPVREAAQDLETHMPDRTWFATTKHISVLMPCAELIALREALEPSDG
jgi:hypothetical protein